MQTFFKIPVMILFWVLSVILSCVSSVIFFWCHECDTIFCLECDTFFVSRVRYFRNLTFWITTRVPSMFKICSKGYRVTLEFFWLVADYLLQQNSFFITSNRLNKQYKKLLFLTECLLLKMAFSNSVFSTEISYLTQCF